MILLAFLFRLFGNDGCHDVYSLEMRFPCRRIALRFANKNSEGRCGSDPRTSPGERGRDRGGFEPRIPGTLPHLPRRDGPIPGPEPPIEAVDSIETPRKASVTALSDCVGDWVGPPAQSSNLRGNSLHIVRCDGHYDAV